MKTLKTCLMMMFCLVPASILAENLVSETVLRSQNLVNVQTMDPRIAVELKYATDDNFLNRNVYGTWTNAYLRLEGAVKLTNAQRILAEKHPGYRLLIYDVLRPRRIQYQMWDIVKGTPQQPYVANPAGGSIHNYGLAVDLTIMDEKGAPLDMGTPFDYFGVKAEPRYEKIFLKPALLKTAGLDAAIATRISNDLQKTGPLTERQYQNRLLLRSVMEKAGFESLVNEWWHFNAFPNAVVKKKFVIVE